MTIRINRRFITAICASGLLVATLGAAPARAENGEITRALAGLAALGLIGAAIIDAQRDRDTVVVTRPAPQPPLVAPGTGRYITPARPARRAALPARCLRNVRLAGVQREIYGAKCARRATQAPLPNACKVEIKRSNGQKVKGYLPRCLRKRGWRL